ncbi:hypothetical protein ACFLXC_01190 [Chloroflexota bacterium]
MKKLILALALVVVLVGLMAAPVMAAKGPYFTTRITSDGDRLPGMLVSHFIYNTEGVSGPLHELGLRDTKTNLELDGLYEFFLEADADQQAALTSYFKAKPWPQDYLDQIADEIDGTAPFFYLKAENSSYSLIDGFLYGLWENGILGGDNNSTLRINDDYPVGLYVYTGDLEGLPVAVTLKVMRWGSGFSTK